MQGWNDSIALVTGGGSGIGRALSIALARRGARVFVSDVNEESATRVAKELGGRAHAARLDVRDAAAFEAWVKEIAEREGRIDFLFNNAGIGVGGETQDLTLAHWDRAIDVNVRGVIHGVAAVYPRMVKQRSGHIVNVASMAGLAPAPLLVPYAMTKHAVVGLSTSLRLEAEPYGVRVSAICPSVIDTPILDSDNPRDLPALGGTWRPNVRRYLSRLGGRPYPVDRMAEESLDGVERNLGLVIVPARARLGWRIARFLPALYEKRIRGILARERAS